MKENKGITLVALIITIIILLILAVVAIKELNGDGIISKAKEAKTGYLLAQEEEEIDTAIGEWDIQKLYSDNPYTTFEEYINAKLSAKADIYIEYDNLIVKFKSTGNKFLVTEKAAKQLEDGE